MITLKKDPNLLGKHLKKLLYLGSEHGICRENAIQIMDICLDDYRFAA